MGAAECGGVLAAGGRGLSTAELLPPAALLQPGGGGWRAVAGLSTVRAYSAGATFGGRFAVFGGIRTTGSGSPDGDPKESCEAYDERADRWLPLPPLPAGGRCMSAAAVLDGGSVALCGGNALLVDAAVCPAGSRLL